MSTITINPSKVSGFVNIPPSKSYAQRAVVAALLKGGISYLENYGNCNDEKVALEIISKLGASVTREGTRLIINSEFTSNKIFSNKLNVGESGLALRLFTCVASLLNYSIEINGEGSLLSRPIAVFEHVFPELSVNINSNFGKLPIVVKGKMKPKNIVVDGAVSSQFLSGFIFAYAYLFKNNILKKTVTIQVNDLSSKPYVDVTIDVLKAFGLPAPLNVAYKEFVFNKVNFKPQHINYNIEGDWSSASFILVAGAIAGKVACSNLNINSRQADIKILDALEQAGVTVELNDEIVLVKRKKNKLKIFDFDATDCPDLFPPLVALAANCNGISAIKGVNRLKHKESNRAKTLQVEFLKLGVEIMIENDIMRIKGGKGIKGAVVNSCNDHRIAMACAIAALNAKTEVKIVDSGAVKKSYPNFFIDLKDLGVGVK